MSTQNPFAAPRAEIRDISTQSSESTAIISSLAVSPAWKVRFFLIERAGGIKLPKLRELKFAERMKIHFNFLAFLFGPIYYAFKGMWKKGLALFILSTLALITLAAALELVGVGRIANALGWGSAVLFSVRANIDFYKKKVLNENGWW